MGMNLVKRSPYFILALAAALLTAFSLLFTSAKVGAAPSNVTGVVREPSNAYSNGAYVYATAPGSSNPIYGPVATNVYGAYTLVVGTAGTYDIHFDPPANMGDVPIVNSSVSVTSAQTINAMFSAQTNTLSGTLKDSSNNPLPSITVKLFKAGSGTYYQTSTNSSGYYSLSAPAGYYYLYLIGSTTGLSFTLSQANTTSINLLSGNQTLDLTLQLATLTITAYNNVGQQEYGGSPTVNARATSGITRLYPGDPGTNISVAFSSGFSTFSSPTGTVTTIVGATFAASGLESSSYTTSICKSVTGSTVYDCLRKPYVVTGNDTFDLPAQPVRTFSGTLTDNSGNPIAGAGIVLTKFGDASISTTTDSSGNFTVNAVPKRYYLKVTGPYMWAGMASFTLTQSSVALPIDLTADSLVQNLQVKNTTLTITANDASGNPNYFTSVAASASSGSTTLYTGDPGETITVGSTGFSTLPSNNTGTVGSIIGAVYSAKGLNVTNPTGSICDTAATSGHWNCLTTALTVSGPTSLNVPF